MKKAYKIVFFVLAMFGFATIANAQVSTTAVATTTILAPISIAKAKDMSFGNIAVSATAGSVVLSTSGVRTASGGVTLPSTSGTVSAAEFTVTGAAGFTFAVTLPTSYTLTEPSGTSMVIDNFTVPSLTGTLTSGSATLPVGATLNVGANQKEATYTNPAGFSVTVNYN